MLLASGAAPKFKYVVTNTGNVTLSNVALTDTMFGPIVIPGSLAVGATNEKVITASWLAGPQTNVATASGSFTDSAGHKATPIGSDAANYFGAAPAIDVTKYVSADGGATWQDANTAPGPMLLASGPAPEFRFVVVNTGNVTLPNVTLSDTVFGSIVIPGTLVAGGSVDKVITATWSAGQYTNVATASGTFTDNAGNAATRSDSDPANYFGAAPALQIVKQASVTTVSTAGSKIVYTYTVTNTGNTTLTHVTVTDDNFTPLNPGDDFLITLNQTTLLPGQKGAISPHREFSGKMKRYERDLVD